MLSHVCVCLCPACRPDDGSRTRSCMLTPQSSRPCLALCTTAYRQFATHWLSTSVFIFRGSEVRKIPVLEITSSANVKTAPGEHFLSERVKSGSITLQKKIHLKNIQKLELFRKTSEWKWSKKHPRRRAINIRREPGNPRQSQH